MELVFWIGVVLLLLSLLGFIAYNITIKDRWNRTDAQEVLLIGSWVLFVCSACVVLFVGILLSCKHLDRADCHGFGDKSGFPTKFVMTSGMNWDCLVEINNNEFVSKSNFDGFVKRN